MASGLVPTYVTITLQSLLFTVIHVNFGQSVYSAKETDREMTITLQDDDISNWTYSVEINPLELLPVGAPGTYNYTY